MSKRIKRDIYLNGLTRRRHNGRIKIITGVRRSGKTYLLFKLFADWVQQQNVNEHHIIKVNLEDRRNKELRDPDKLLSYFDSLIKYESMHYVMIDEIQHVREFEDVLNSYLGMDN